MSYFRAPSKFVFLSHSLMINRLSVVLSIFVFSLCYCDFSIVQYPLSAPVDTGGGAVNWVSIRKSQNCVTALSNSTGGITNNLTTSNWNITIGNNNNITGIYVHFNASATSGTMTNNKVLLMKPDGSVFSTQMRSAMYISESSAYPLSGQDPLWNTTWKVPDLTSVCYAFTTANFCSAIV